MGGGGGEGYAISEHPTCAEDASALRVPNVPPRCSPLANGGGDGSGVIGGSAAQRSGVPCRSAGRVPAVVATAAGERDADSAQASAGGAAFGQCAVCRHIYLSSGRRPPPRVARNAPAHANLPVRSMVRAVLLMSYHNSAWRAAAPPAYPPPRRADIRRSAWSAGPRRRRSASSSRRRDSYCTAHCGVGARADRTPRALPAHRRAAARGRARGTHVTCDSVVDEILRRR